MNEFSKKWAAIGKHSRRESRRKSQQAAQQHLSLGLRMRLTPGQMKAAAKTMVDIAIKRAKAA